MCRKFERMDIIGMAFSLAEAVSRFSEGAKQFYYDVMLSDHPCPDCGGSLSMVGEGRCECRSCGKKFDPTVEFQNCGQCSGQVVLRVRRYQCAQCGADVPSRFLFDGLVFDAEYFRQKMAEHRQKREEQREKVRLMLAECRSGVLALPGADLEDVPGLAEALNGLTAGAAPSLAAWLPSEFDLARYESHIQAHIGAMAVGFDQIPPLGENRRLDRVRRFIAIIFLAHAGLVRIRQEGRTIWVMKNETDGEGQDIPGDAEEADRVEGPLGGIEAG
jgi:hypothetical protein